ncbi:MAG: bifunctional DNA-formamidopyrimidine glycosylase/DNA-(apurinic or apyrimidinic site) lyase [Bdellovibrionaceae bacterium]|nr:bifunctional DNA-formamidopyrimidine glycosylase/DNA-(apurinic or apyrimidinic site) lyase [Pseudobdellovibrionaceae bacterium]
MPELPEVEVLRRDLESRLPKPARISRIHFFAPKLRTPLQLPTALEKASWDVLAIGRRSKFLIFETNHGILISHLGMSGYWRVEAALNLIKHDHVVLQWKSGEFWVYNDPRRFGVFEFYPSIDKVKWFSRLGPEPFTDEFMSDAVVRSMRSSGRAIKSIIMDAQVMVGVGNIYASEALFRAGINPFKSGRKVPYKKMDELRRVIRTTLLNAIKGGGSSIRDYVHAGGEKGRFQDKHLVYGREGKSCVKCGTIIQSRKCQGRSTFWCRVCQS